MRDPIGPELPGDKQVVDTLLNILSKEEQASGLPPSPEFLGIADVRRPNKSYASDNFRSNRRPNPRPGLESRNYCPPNPRPNTKPNSWQANQSSNDVPEGGGDKNWRANFPRNNSGTFRPNRSEVFSRAPKGKDLGSLKYKTGIADVDFLVGGTRTSASHAEGNNVEHERGQWFGNDTNRSSSMHDNGTSTYNKGWRNEVDARNGFWFSKKSKSKYQFTTGKGSTNQMPNSPRDSQPPPANRLAQSAGKSPSENQANNYPLDQPRRIVAKESAQFAQGSVPR
jgi:hypothetical protein